MVQIYIIAGEASGDLLGARLMRALKKRMPDAVFQGVGGARMEAEGFQSLSPLSDIALMGFAEVVPHLPRLWQRLRQVIDDVRVRKPAIVITIDAQAFGRRIAKALQPERREGLRLVQYVAPSVWAYKPERAKWFSELYDHMLCILPFELPYFEAVGLPCSFIGHPLQEEIWEGEGDSFRLRHGLSQDAPLLGMFPGSRLGEIERHLPLFAETVSLLKEKIPQLACAVLSHPVVSQEIFDRTRQWPTPIARADALTERADMLAACDTGLSKSGTVTLELAATGLPTVMVHRINPLSMWLARRMIRVRFVSLVNLLERYEVIPELLQEMAKPVTVASELEHLFTRGDLRARQQEGMASALKKLHSEAASPSDKAAAVIEGLLRG